MITVIIVQYNKVELTKQAIRSFRRFHPNEQVILVDNGSVGFNGAEIQEEFPGVEVILNEKNIGFGAANNQGAKQARGEILLFLNNDTLTETHLTSRVEREFSENPHLGILGIKLLNPDHSFQLSAGALPTFFREIGVKMLYGLLQRHEKSIQRYLEKKYNQKQTVGWVTGAALFIRKDLFMLIGGFDETLFMYFEDVDLCHRVGRNNDVLYFPESSVIHIRGGSATRDALARQIYQRSHLQYYEKYRPVFERFLLRLYMHIEKSIGITDNRLISIL